MSFESESYHYVRICLYPYKKKSFTLITDKRKEAVRFITLIQVVPYALSSWNYLQELENVINYAVIADTFIEGDIDVIWYDVAPDEPLNKNMCKYTLQRSDTSYVAEIAYDVLHKWRNSVHYIDTNDVEEIVARYRRFLKCVISEYFPEQRNVFVPLYLTDEMPPGAFNGVPVLCTNKGSSELDIYGDETVNKCCELPYENLHMIRQLPYIRRTQPGCAMN